MTFTITAGWWLIPASLTAVGLVWALWPDSGPPGYGNSVVGAFKLLVAIIVILVFWLVWSLLT